MRIALHTAGSTLLERLEPFLALTLGQGRERFRPPRRAHLAHSRTRAASTPKDLAERVTGREKPFS